MIRLSRGGAATRRCTFEPGEMSASCVAQLTPAVKTGS